MQMNDNQKLKLKLLLRHEANNYVHFRQIYSKVCDFIATELNVDEDYAKKRKISANNKKSFWKDKVIKLKN